MNTTKVVFRTFPDGDVLALFPELPATYDPRFCESYAHIGQHSAASAYCLVGCTRPATPSEIRPLAKELRRIGYRLDVRKRITSRMHDMRIRTINRLSSST